MSDLPDYFAPKPVPSGFRQQCNATLTVRDTHTCERQAGHALDNSVWKRNAETHQCCGFQWIDGAEGSTPHADVEIGRHRPDQDPVIEARRIAALAASVVAEEPEARAWEPADGDKRCQECGRENPVWWADNGDWNAIMPDDGVLCPTCYHRAWLEARPGMPVEQETP